MPTLIFLLSNTDTWINSCTLLKKNPRNKKLIAQFISYKSAIVGDHKTCSKTEEDRRLSE